MTKCLPPKVCGCRWTLLPPIVWGCGRQHSFNPKSVAADDHTFTLKSMWLQTTTPPPYPVIREPRVSQTLRGGLPLRRLQHQQAPDELLPIRWDVRKIGQVHRVVARQRLGGLGQDGHHKKIRCFFLHNHNGLHFHHNHLCHGAVAVAAPERRHPSRHQSVGYHSNAPDEEKSVKEFFQSFSPKNMILYLTTCQKLERQTCSPWPPDSCTPGSHTLSSSPAHIKKLALTNLNLCW